MTKTWLTVAFAMASAVAYGQNTSQVQRLFESGDYQRVVEAATPDGDPAILYAAAQSHQKLGETDGALAAYAALAARDEGDAWHHIGLSGQQLMQDNVDGAASSARRAVEISGDMAEAHYQLGLVLAKQQAWPAAATEFDRVTALNPSHAYAYYYGGLMHYRANRPDRMATHFEQFLKLAPEAPERPEVMSIMRTVRGR